MRDESVDQSPFPADYRGSGLLLHLTSLPSRYGIGDVGPAALAWLDRLQEADQSWWQSLPLGPTGYGNSPYQPLSSFAGNGLLISPDWLIEDGLLQASDCQDQSFPREEVDYDRVIPYKHRLLETAWANFTAGGRADLRPSFEEFRDKQAHWLEDYALFRALKAKYKGVYFLECGANSLCARPSARRAGCCDQSGMLRAVSAVPPSRPPEDICSRQGRASHRGSSLFRVSRFQ